ncbi:protein LSM14 homolog B [Pholidichthys leucotaenia]
MASARPYIGCRIALISKAQNRYEGILFTIDKTNCTLVLAEVKCFGTEGRPTDRPTPPRDDVYEYITFRGSDIKDITLCEPPRLHHGLPPDPAIIQTSCVDSSGIFSAPGPFSPARLAGFDQLAANTLLNHQYAAALNLGKLLVYTVGLHVRRGPMVEKAVQTGQVDILGQRTALTISQVQAQRPERRRPQRASRASPPTRKRAGAVTSQRRRNRSRGQLMATVPRATLKFDADFDFDSSNAQFNKEELEKEIQDSVNIKDGNCEVRETEGSPLSEDDLLGPKCYYDKAKSFFDNISSNSGSRLTWAEERKLNLETFGVPGRFLRGQGFRGSPRRGRGGAAARASPP